MQPALAPAMLLGGLLAGYSARRWGLVPERFSRTLHLVNILVFQANTSWLTMWGVSWRWEMIRLPALGLVLSVALTLVGLAAGRLHRFDRRDGVTFALCCGMSNLGSTGGLLVIRVLVSDEALQRGMIFLLYWSLFAFLFCFPLAKRLGGTSSGRARRFLGGALLDIRMLPLAGMFAGLALGSLVQAGVLGLLRALDAYDPTRGVSLSTYCAWQITWAMHDDQRAFDWLPESLRTRAQRLRRAADELRDALGREPCDEELAAESVKSSLATAFSLSLNTLSSLAATSGSRWASDW